MLLIFSCQTFPVKQSKELFKSVPVENENILFGLPSSDCQLLIREGYTLCHDSTTRNADWVSYQMSAEYLVKGVARIDDFRADPDLAVGKRSELSDYRRSGYDRGHLVAAADMNRSAQTMSESFYLSNMSPQLPAFNRGIWKILEERVRDLARDKGKVYVLTGPLFPDSQSQKTIGDNAVYVPSHFFKIIVAGDRSNPASLQAIAFVIPNESFEASQLNSFVVTVDEVEAQSGLDFFHELDDAIEQALESRNRLRM